MRAFSMVALGAAVLSGLLSIGPVSRLLSFQRYLPIYLLLGYGGMLVGSLGMFIVWLRRERKNDRQLTPSVMCSGFGLLVVFAGLFAATEFLVLAGVTLVGLGSLSAFADPRS